MEGVERLHELLAGLYGFQKGKGEERRGKGQTEGERERGFEGGE